MFKRIIAIAVAAILVMSMAVVAVSAAEVSDSNVGADSSSQVGADSSSSTSSASGNEIYFDAAGWKSFSKIYCHIWVIGGASFHGWQTPAEECKKVSGTKFSYDLSKLESSLDVSGGMKSGGKYGIIFSANTGAQTFDSTIGVECKGDTAELTGEMLENPVDSNKKCYEAVWSKNSSKYGPHLALTSIGNVVGSKLAPGETGIQVIGDWVPSYFNSPNVDAVKALANAYPKFGIKTVDDITNVYAYVMTKEEVDKADYKAIKKTLEDAFKKAYPSQASEKIIIDPIEADKKAKGGAEAIVNSGSSGSGSSTGTSGDNSGSGADGQETTIFFVLAGVMAAAAGAMFISRKKREE